MLDLNHKSILITGGTGSFGKAFIRIILKRYPNIERVVVFSRDEQKHFHMQMEFPEHKHKAIRYFIGDVRDRKRLFRAFEGVDIVVHAAAMKHVHIAEQNPLECVNTNILGAENVIDAALACGVKNVVALSTDKAAAPISLYGATKLVSDKLFVAANNIKGKRDIKFSVVRYGNVMGSNDSIVPFFLKKKDEGVLPITDVRMTRFNISPDESVDMVLNALQIAFGGEIFVPKIASYRVVDVATAIAPECEHEIVGIRPGEKLHEEMITKADAINTWDLGKYYAILPQNPIFKLADFIKHFNAKRVAEDFSYNSNENTEWETIETLRAQIKLYVDPNFSV